MLTDDDLDRRLLAAGARWRVDHADEADVQFAPHRRVRTPLVIAAAVVVALAVALPLAWFGRDTRSAAGSAQSLIGTWVLRSANGASTADDYLTLTFTSGRMTFSDGINTGVGTAVVHGDEVMFSDIAQTTVGGASADPVRDAVDSTLTGTARWSVAGDRLTVTKGSDRLVYIAEPALLLQLTGAHWNLSYYSDGKAMNRMPFTYPADFAGSRFTTGTDNDCLGIVGRLRIDRNQLFFSSQKYAVCSGPPGGSTEFNWLPDVYAAFKTKAAWSIENGRLTLSSGTTRLIFTAR